MSNSKQTTEKPASEQAVLKALAANPEATAAEVATDANVGRSTASKVLARLASSGEARRTEGGVDVSAGCPTASRRRAVLRRASGEDRQAEGGS